MSCAKWCSDKRVPAFVQVLEARKLSPGLHSPCLLRDVSRASWKARRVPRLWEQGFNGARCHPVPWLDIDDLCGDRFFMMQISVDMPAKPRNADKQASHTLADLLRLDLTRHRLESSVAPLRHDATQKKSRRFINLTRFRDCSMRQSAINCLANVQHGRCGGANHGSCPAAFSISASAPNPK